MNVTLTPEQEKFVSEQVNQGHYHSAEEIVQQGLELLRTQEKFIQENLVQLRNEIGIGISAAEKGELIDGEEFFARLLEDLRSKPVGQ